MTLVLLCGLLSMCGQMPAGCPLHQPPPHFLSLQSVQGSRAEWGLRGCTLLPWLIQSAPGWVGSISTPPVADSHKLPKTTQKLLNRRVVPPLTLTFHKVCAPSMQTRQSLPRERMEGVLKNLSPSFNCGPVWVEMICSSQAQECFGATMLPRN